MPAPPAARPSPASFKKSRRAVLCANSILDPWTARRVTFELRWLWRGRQRLHCARGTEGGVATTGGGSAGRSKFWSEESIIFVGQTADALPGSRFIGTPFPFKTISIDIHKLVRIQNRAGVAQPRFRLGLSCVQTRTSRLVLISFEIIAGVFDLAGRRGPAVRQLECPGD